MSEGMPWVRQYRTPTDDELEAFERRRQRRAKLQRQRRRRAASDDQ